MLVQIGNAIVNIYEILYASVEQRPCHQIEITFKDKEEIIIKFDTEEEALSAFITLVDKCQI